MKQVLQNMRAGSTMVIETPIPQVRPKTALVQTAVSLVSAWNRANACGFCQ